MLPDQLDPATEIITGILLLYVSLLAYMAFGVIDSRRRKRDNDLHGTKDIKGR